MEFNVTGRDGALTRYEIIGDIAEATEIVKSVTTYSVWETETGIKGSANKREIGSIRERVEATKVKPRAVQGKKSERYIELALFANDNGLNHGKSWVCSLSNVEQHSLSPEWQGELICYVYPS